MAGLHLFGLEGLPEIEPGMDLAELILKQLAPDFLQDGDIFVVASKIISKLEGCIVAQDDIPISEEAASLAALTGRSPTYVALTLQEAARVVKASPGVLITKTRHGFVVANSGIDGSNAGRKSCYLTLPPNPDQSALHLRQRLYELCGKRVGIILSDTFGRAWRQGQTDIAIGCSGLPAFLDYRGTADRDGNALHYTMICCADELAGAAELLMGKSSGIPVVHIRGFHPQGEGAASLIPYSDQSDLFL